jgi:hypothetical protein
MASDVGEPVARTKQRRRKGRWQYRVQHLPGPGAGPGRHALRSPLLLALPLRVVPRPRALPGVPRLQGRGRGGEARPPIWPWGRLHRAPGEVRGRRADTEQADRAAPVHRSAT